MIKVLNILSHIMIDFKLKYIKLQLNFHGSCFKEENLSLTQINEVNIYVVYERNLW